jgi:hypothetical protein
MEVSEMQYKECSRCLLNEGIPGVTFPDQSEVCSVCIEYDHTWGKWIEKRAELKQLFDGVRKKKRDYDVLVPLSGGKDSSYVVYLCRREFNLKCLAVTFDNGFLSDHARQNITETCNRLGVDHIYYSLNREFLMGLYRQFFLKTGFFCPVCLRGMGVAIGRVQLAFKVPLAISGTSRRTEEHIDQRFYLDGDLSFVENVLSEKGINEDHQVLLRPIGVFRSPARIKLPDYLEWDYNKIYKTITTELGWKSPKKEAEHTDCKVEPVVQYIRYKKFPEISTELLRFSKLVTCGQMPRDEARRHVEEEKMKVDHPAELDWFLDNTGITEKEFDDVLSNPLRHIKYTKKKSAAVRRIRALKHVGLQ